jgi:hypothetical protein
MLSVQSACWVYPCRHTDIPSLDHVLTAEAQAVAIGAFKAGLHIVFAIMNTVGGGNGEGQ